MFANKITEDTLNELLSVLQRLDLVVMSAIVPFEDKPTEMILAFSLFTHRDCQILNEFIAKKELKFVFIPVFNQILIVIYQPAELGTYQALLEADRWTNMLMIIKSYLSHQN